MDKEKLLKKFIAKFVVGQTLASAFIFLWIFAHEYGYISKDQFIKSGLIISAVAIVFGTIDYLLFNKKSKKERLAVMPLIISIHDTEEKLKKQKTILYVLYFTFFVGGLTFRSVSVVFIVMFAVSPCFNFMANLVNDKIKYLENKPECLNF